MCGFARHLLGGYLLAGFVLIGPSATAQDYEANIISRHVLTNEGVISLAKAGFDELFILERIRTSRTKFDASVHGLVALKEAGVSEDLIRAIARQDRSNYLQEHASLTAPPGPPPAPVPRVIVEKHWWGFRWTVVSP